MAWNALIATASNDQTLARARSALGRRTVYQLGAGGMRPAAGLDNRCDCSGFVAWAIGIPRQLPPGRGGWLDTDAYARGGAPVFPGLLSPVSPGQARPGDIWVYPDYQGVDGRKREGHMGIISQVNGAGVPTRVIHCSVSNSRAGDAVQETGTSIWTSKPASRVMRIDYVQLRAKHAPGGAPVFPLPSGVLKHPHLAGDAVLQSIAAGTAPALRATGARVEGAGALQDALNHLGALYPELRVDLGSGNRFRGIFGPGTDAAVKRFQGTHGLTADGAVGRNTLRALDAALGSVDSNSGVDRTRSVPTPA